MVKFGVAGYPLAFTKSPYRKNRLDITRWVAELGLDAVELQMTYGPRTTPENCRALAAAAKDSGITLTVHAAYYIVFTSDDPTKIRQSADTLLRTFELADLLGANVVVLHPGPLYNGKDEEALARFIDNAGTFMHTLGKTEIGLFAETAGKIGQLGSVEDILTISSQLPGVHPCIDFGHVHARTLGTLEDPHAIFNLTTRFTEFLHSNPTRRIHFHYTPIHYGPRGEVQHRAVEDQYPTTPQTDLFGATKPGQGSRDGWYHPRPEPVAEALKRIPRDFLIISETHNSQERGALALKRAYQDTF